MREEFKNRTYYPADIEAATDGYVDRKTQHSWHAREKWLTPTDTPLAGKPRAYRLEHVFEAAILATCVQFGLTLEQGRQAIHRRLMQQAHRHALHEKPDWTGAVSFWEGDVREAIFDLPEFQKMDPESAVFWAIYMGKGIAPPRHSAHVIGVRVIDAGTTAEDIVGEGVAVILLDMTKIINGVTTVLLERAAGDGGGKSEGKASDE